jgi:hypothetical protein
MKAGRQARQARQVRRNKAMVYRTFDQKMIGLMLLKLLFFRTISQNQKTIFVQAMDKPRPSFQH